MAAVLISTYIALGVLIGLVLYMGHLLREQVKTIKKFEHEQQLRETVGSMREWVVKIEPNDGTIYDEDDPVLWRWEVRRWKYTNYTLQSVGRTKTEEDAMQAAQAWIKKHKTFTFDAELGTLVQTQDDGDWL